MEEVSKLSGVGEQYEKGQESVINLMSLDLYPRFLGSDYFMDLQRTDPETPVEPRGAARALLG